MNPCIRCAHFINNPNDVMNSKCGHPDLQKINVITGESQPTFCTTSRLLGNKCGPTGELWAYEDAFPAEEWQA